MGAAYGEVWYVIFFFPFCLPGRGEGISYNQIALCALADADSKKTEFPLFLTTWHMFFATVVTQCLAKFTTILDSRHKVPMNRETYTRAILPIGLFFSFSLICGNVAYLYLSVSFIQMLKV